MANSKNKPSSDLLNHLQARLSHYIEPGQSVCVALSGGVDSVVLLWATFTLAGALGIRQVNAVHVHHGLSANADAWEAFCSQLCRQLGVSLRSQRVNVTPQGEGIEAAARQARFQVFESETSDWILLAHHRDDQAETVLLNLLRGAGVRGAAGMNEIRGRFLRPLLDIAREQIVEYARRNALTWVEDESNFDCRFSRNHLRHEVMPRLAETFPQAGSNLARAAQVFREAADLLDEIAEEDLGDADDLTVSRMRALSTPRALNLLAYCLRREGLQIPANSKLREMLRQLIVASDDNDICFNVGDRQIRRFRDKVYLDVSAPIIKPVAWHGEGSVSWGNDKITTQTVTGGGMATLQPNEPLQFSARRAGSIMQLRPDGPRRPLKDILRETGVPPWRRKTLPVLYAGEEVAWVAGVGVAAKYRCKPGMAGFLIEFDGVNW